MDQFIAKTFQGLEPVLAREIELLGGLKVEPLKRAVSFEASMKNIYKMNMGLRTALHIIHPIAIERVRSQDELYQVVRAINWSKWFTPNQTFAVRTVVNHAEAFQNSLFVALKTKDAIVDQFRDFYTQRPSIDRENPDIEIHVNIYGEQCTISIDSSGSSLHRRGYRDGSHPAPLNEVLAAGLVLLSSWDKKSCLIDFMCGSGTIITEAALMAKNMSPNLNRKRFAFQYWKNFDQSLYDNARDELVNAQVEFEEWIYGSDIHERSIKEARNNCLRAEVDDIVKLSVSDFKMAKLPKTKGVIISNPPYGERLQVDELELLYKTIGDTLKKNYQGFQAHIFSGNPEASKRIGLKPSKKTPLYNGSIPCQFLQFDLYEGSKTKPETR